jgi:catechol 2,3-dioxygenase-like lactoylglutathione lyase family enzyme
MNQVNPSILSHVSIGTNDFEKARAFYQQVLATLDIQILMDFPGATAYGRYYPEFWVQTPIDGKPAAVGNGTHFAFVASDKQQVDAFYQAAIAAGATCDGPPGPRPLYSDAYYGCFVRDLDGHKIEATFWDESLAPAANH